MGAKWMPFSPFRLQAVQFSKIEQEGDCRMLLAKQTEDGQISRLLPCMYQTEDLIAVDWSLCEWQVLGLNKH
jgi:hypothetical protein